MIDRSNSLIFSHPRSGSYWFQESLPHYDMNELFNVRNISSVSLGKDNLLCSHYGSRELTGEKLVIEYQHRLELFNSINRPKSVKIHHFQLRDQWIVNWVLSQKDAGVIFLERKDKVKAFYSLLISNSLKKFKGLHQNNEVIVPLDSIDMCYTSIFEVPDSVNLIKDQFNFSHFYYEDLLDNTVSWIDKSKPKIVKQDTVDAVKIINIEEVENYLTGRYDVSSRRIF